MWTRLARGWSAISSQALKRRGALAGAGAITGGVLAYGKPGAALCEKSTDGGKEDPAASTSITSSVASVYTYLSEGAYSTFVAPFTEPSSDKLLPGFPERLKGKEPPTLVIALDDVLIHSTWDRQYGWRYMKRPGVDQFLKALGQFYEIVVWTDQFSLMEPVIVTLDQHRVIRHRLYKDAMVYRNGKYVKDLRHLNRDLKRVVVLDCKEENAQHQKENYVFVKPFTSDSTDKATYNLAAYVPYFLHLARETYINGEDVR